MECSLKKSSIEVLLAELPGKALIEHQKQFRIIADKAEFAFRRGNFHSAVVWTQIAARFAWERHPGFYYDLILESLLTEIANKIDERSLTLTSISEVFPHEENHGKIHVLHVITGCKGLGGHTLVVAGWIKNTLETAIHSIVATTQKEPLPLALTSLAKRAGGSCLQLADFSSDLLDRSLLLRQVGKLVDLIAIHVDPSDAIPNVAFGVKGGPPVVLYNHADDVFWLGISVADVVLDLHPSGQSQTLNRRGAKTSKFLPIPLNEPPEVLNYEHSRKQLGITPGTKVLLTIGRECKYLGVGGHDFLDVAGKILKKHSNAILFAIGPENQGIWAKAYEKSHGRINPLGGIEWSKLPPYYAAADIFLDSFPIGSGTAFLEAGLRGIPTIGLQFKEAPSITEGADELAFKDLNEFPSSIEEYSTLLEKMIAEPLQFRERARKFKELITIHHVSPGWTDYLTDIIRGLPKMHSINLPKSFDSNIEHVNNFVADWDAKVLGNETTKQTYARLMMSYSDQLQKAEVFQEQAINFARELLKAPDLYDLKMMLYYYRKSVFS